MQQNDNSVLLAPILAQVPDTFATESFDVAENVRAFIEQHSQRSEDPVVLVDLDHICRKYAEWQEQFPRVHPHYAVKCNPNINFLRTLRALGARFDCASKEEIEAVLSLGDIDADRDIIYANPTKPRSHLAAARRHGVRLMTFDNADELHKIKQCYPEAQLVLRIMTDDSKAACRFSAKYGAPLNVCQELLRLAIELQLNVVGVSFHVGSGQTDPAAFGDAVERAYRVFQAAKDLGINMTLLDIGGGFPGTDETESGITFAAIAAHMRPKLDELFPPESGVHLIAEPGRYFALGTMTVICNVIARRDCSSFRDEHTNPEEIINYIYYVNEGTYGVFNSKYFDHARIKIQVLGKENTPAATMLPSTVFGPTCDALDCLDRRVMLPVLNIGDWVYMPDMGSYTTAAASCFNGFTRPREIYLRRRPALTAEFH